MRRVDFLRDQAEVFWRIAETFDDPERRSEARRHAATFEEMISDLLREQRATKTGAASGSMYESVRANWGWT